ncbi:MAG: histidine kinase [Bacillales bacterium]|nr:histidine kinase [Bacillales bacterium]
MDTKLKNYSHSLLTKIIIFVMVVISITGALTSVIKVEVINDGYFSTAVEEDYFTSSAYVRKVGPLLNDLSTLISEYKSEENILKGVTISDDDIKKEVDVLFYEYQSISYKPELSEEENYNNFKKVYANEISQARDKLIREDIKEFNLLLQTLENNKDFVYYASDGVNTYKNIEKENINNYPSYIKFENYRQELYPEDLNRNNNLGYFAELTEQFNPDSDVIYLGYKDEFLNSEINKWKKNKEVATSSLYILGIFLLVFIPSFIYLVIVIGRKSFKDNNVSLNFIDKLYNDVNFILCIITIAIWVSLIEAFDFIYSTKVIVPITAPFVSIVVVLLLSLIKHYKNKTLLRNTIIFNIINVIVKFVRNVYNSGNVGVKTVLVVIGYPILIAMTFFMFPVTIGIAAWFAYNKIKSFNAIKEGVERIKSGDINHIIEIEGKGQFKQMAENINGITEGLKNAVDNELKSERMKTELITNVSHDIRTPLTSIITYVDLLKKEEHQPKVEEYLEVLDQKSKRLKVLTDDLFEAAKASSGNIPVNLERIDILSLITQGLGEVNAKIEALDLNFKINHPKENVYITADGKLLWRSIENLLSNIFKYALRSSRVYIDIEDKGNEILITFKNISAYELNISADELMERFKRGDESRSSQGSGLGLSIAKSLIDMQKGRFNISVDGDLFKAMIYLPKQ